MNSDRPSVEPLRSWDAPASTRASSRLYAQGVRLLEHKDSVFRQFGLLRPSATPTPAAGSPRASAMTQQRKMPLAQATGKSRRAPRATRERAMSAPYASDRHTLAIGSMARTFSFRSTVESRMLVTPPPKAHGSQHHHQPYQSHHYHQHKRLANGAASDKTRGFGASGGSRAMVPTTSMSSSGRQPSGRTTAKAATHRQQQQSTRSGLAASRRDEGATAAKRQSVRIGVPTTFTGALAASSSTSPPVTLVQVSRRTSSPIVTPSVAEFGMRKRPSVSPIPSLQAEGDGLSPPGPPQPRASVLVRRDSKMERLLEQVTVLKASLGLSDDDLHWKVESTKGNAFLAAERHLTDGEERYDRLVYEVQLLSQTPCEEVAAGLVKRVRAIMAQAGTVAANKSALAASQSDAARFKKEILDARVASELQQTADVADDSNSTRPLASSPDLVAELSQQLEDAKTRIVELHETLPVDILRLNDMVVALSSDTDRLAATCAEFTFLSPEVADVSAQLVALLRRVPEHATGGDKLQSLGELIVQTAQRLRGSRLRDLKRKETELAAAIADIEVWKTRREHAKECATELATREQQWRLDHANANNDALRLMRSLVPPDVQQLSVDAIVAQAAHAGVLYTFDLATYVKQNRFLHWLRTHASDVARDNFLAVESASHFLTFATTLDIHELRALSTVVPLSATGGFEFDKDGRKAEWKAQFLDHVYALVARQRGESVKAGWDPVRRARGDVPLPPLTAKQELNAVYRYPTEAEIDARVAKFERQRERLELKREKLRGLDDALIPAAKAEYVAIAEDARSNALQRSFGKATLVRMRDDAKQALQALVKSRDALAAELAHAERQWNAQSPTFAQFLDEAAKVRALDPETREARIRGPFEPDAELRPRARAAFKKLSVEEEAQARRCELESAIASRGKEISEAQTTVATVATTSSSSASSSFRADATVPDAVEPSAASRGSSSFRRVKSLEVSTEVLRFLQQEFCSSQRVQTLAAAAASSTGGGGGAPKAALAVAAALRLKRFASDVNLETRSGDDLTVSAAATAPVKPKSKALLKLLEKETESGGRREATDSERPPSPLKGNIFSELQTRVAAKTSNRSSSDGTETGAETGAGAGGSQSSAPMSFLDELKRKTTRTTRTLAASADGPALSPPAVDVSSAVVSASPMSVREQERSVEEVEVVAPPPAPQSFLNELQARVRSSEDCD